MRRSVLCALSAAAVAASLALAGPAGATRPHRLELNAGPAMGHVPARDAKPAKPGGTSGANMTSHGGAIMVTASTYPIFWGTGWNSATFTDDKISGLDDWYAGYGGSAYAGASTEYTGTNGQVTTTVGVADSSKHYVDATATPSGAPSTSTVLTEVKNALALAHVTPAANGYYPVYSDQPRGNAGYCAWHSYGTIGVTPVQFAFFFNLDGDPGCDPQDSTTGHHQGLAALANVSAHELSEAMTDPRNGGWYDRQGAENGDKCAWTFGADYVTFSNHTTWKLQGEWSNAAYTASTGYANSKGQKGCLSGV